MPYDGFGQLDTATCPTRYGLTESDGYAYDDGGNRDDSASSAYVYDTNDRVADSPGRVHKYDADGNPTEIWNTGETQQLAALTWDETNRLTSYENLAGSTKTTLTSSLV